MSKISEIRRITDKFIADLKKYKPRIETVGYNSTRLSKGSKSVIVVDEPKKASSSTGVWR